MEVILDLNKKFGLKKSVNPKMCLLEVLFPICEDILICLWTVQRDTESSYA